MEREFCRVGSASRRSRTTWRSALGSGLGALALCVALAGSATATSVMSLSPNGLDFGNQPMGSHSNQQTIQLTNSGNSNLVVTDVRLVGANPGEFLIMDQPPTGSASTAKEVNESPAAIGPGQGRPVSLVFSPRIMGICTAFLVIASNATSEPVLIPLTGWGTTGHGGVPELTPVASLSVGLASLSATTLDFGTVTGSRVVVLANTGTAPLLIQNINLVGDAAFWFTVSGGGNVLQPGESRAITVHYTQGVIGSSAHAILIVFSNAPGGVIGAALRGGAPG